MKTILVVASLIGAFSNGAALAASSSASSSSGGGSTVTATGSDGRDCEVVNKAAGERPGGPLTSTVTAGSNGVSGGTTGGQTVTTDSSGDCTVTFYDKDK